jgi:hypothetical protein
MKTLRDLSAPSTYHLNLFCGLPRANLILSLDSIIAVHGLGSNPDTTWQSRTTVPLEGSSDQEIYPIWLRDFLPQDLQKDGFRVRVMAFNHNTRWKTNALNKSLEDYGQDLLRELAEKRRSVEVGDLLYGSHLWLVSYAA